MYKNLEPIKKFIGSIEYDENLYAVLAAVVVVIITVVIFFFFQRKRINRRNVLITGLSDAGKTLLFARLTASKVIVTYTSMKENISVYKVDKKKTVTLIDIPGNERIRDQYMEKFLAFTRGIVFVIDSFNFPKEIRDVAGFLYILLQEPLVHANRIPFLIACNKQDHAVSKSAKVIQSQLEKEINTLRVTQTGQLASLSGSGDKVFLGHRGRDFQFSDLKSIKIDFMECSASEEEDNVTDLLKNWLLKIA